MVSCAQRATDANVRIAAFSGPMPAAPIASPNAPPKIVRIWLSSTVISPNQELRMKVTTSTNVASVEARCELVSYNLKRITFGQFAYRVRVPELIPLVRRHYLWRFIARNAAGVEATEGVDIWLK